MIDNTEIITLFKDCPLVYLKDNQLIIHMLAQIGSALEWIHSESAAFELPTKVKYNLNVVQK